MTLFKSSVHTPYTVVSSEETTLIRCISEVFWSGCGSNSIA